MADRILNPFSGLQPPDSGSEQIVQAKPAALDEAVEKAYQIYVGLDSHISYLFYEEELGKLEKQILFPGQIDCLLQVIISETEPEKVNSRVTGLYISRLIQDSYNAGNNDFVLTTEDTHIDGIGYKLSGSKEKRLKIRIDGNAGDKCWWNADSIEITIYGNAGDRCLLDANSSEIVIYGDAGDWFGEVANSSEIVIYGDAGECCGCWARNTKFTAHNEQAYGMFKEYTDCDRGNTIRLVDSSGKLIKEEHL